VQTLLAQSESAAHAEPAVQGAHLPPPQSTSVSAPSDTPSVQVAGRHTSPWQWRAAQSAFDLHAWFTAHGAQSGPPQS